MSWLTPLGFAWLALLGPLVAMYVLKPSRVTKVVPSTWLWANVARELSARHPWQRLRPYVSLFLQALALVLGAVALARPSCGTVSRSTETVAIVVDASLSMQARDADGTRIEQAAKRAADLARSLGPGGRVLVVAAGPSPVLRLSPSSDASRIAQVVRSTPLFGARPDLDAGVELAVARLRGVRGKKRIVVLSDAAVTDPVRAVPGTSLSLERVGSVVSNVGIVAADVRAREGEPDRVEIFARVLASGERSHTVDLVVTDERDTLLASRRITVRRGAPESIVATATLPARADGSPGIVRVALRRPDGRPFEDAFAADDIAVCLGPGRGRLPVLLAGDVPSTLARGFRADARVEAFAVTAEAYARRVRESVPFEGLVVLGHDVPGPFPEGPSVVLSPDVPASFGLTLAPAVPIADVVTFDASDPRLRFGAPEDTSLARVRALGDGVPLVITRAGVAMARVRHARGEALVLAFDPDLSAFAREPAFVLFLHDTLTEARRALGETTVLSGGLGEPLRIRARDAVRAKVVLPNGESVERALANGVVVIDVPPFPGIYTVTTGARTERIARALLDAEESDLTPRLVVRAANGRSAPAARVPKEHREWLPYLALFVLALIIADAAWAKRQEAV